MSYGTWGSRCPPQDPGPSPWYLFQVRLAGQEPPAFLSRHCLCPHCAHLGCLGTISDSAQGWPDPQPHPHCCPVSEETDSWVGGEVSSKARGGAGADQLVPASHPRCLPVVPSLLQGSKASGVADKNCLSERLWPGPGHVGDCKRLGRPFGTSQSKHRGTGAPGWPQSVAQILISRFVSSNTRIGLCADSSEPGACFGFWVSPSLSAPPLLALSVSLSLSLSLKNEH